MFTIKKTFHLAYAHRLMEHKGKCRNLHGHNALVEVTLKARKLNSEKMVMDFTDLARVMKKWLDDNLDHKVLLAKKDPLLKLLQKEGQDCFATAQNPTAEILAELIFKALKRAGLPVHKVAFWETPTSMAGYKE